MTQEKAPYFVIQTQVVLMDNKYGRRTFLKDSPEEGVADELQDAGVIADRENGIARLGILVGYLGRKDAKPLVEAIIGHSDTTLTEVEVLLIQMDKNDHVHHPGVARVLVYVTKRPDDGGYSIQAAGGVKSPLNKEDE